MSRPRQSVGLADGGQFTAKNPARAQVSLDSDDTGQVPTGWPAVGYEERNWVSSISPDLVSRSVRERHSGPYQAAVTPQITTVSVDLPADTLARADDATVAITRFDAEIGAELAPFSSILLRSESASSSMIENLSSGTKQIALAEVGASGKQNANEIVGNVAAMRAALDLAEDISADSILAMHRALMERIHPEIAGQWRHEQVWIGGDSYGPHGAEYIAPHQDRVPAAIEDLVAFARRDDVPVLVQAALTHAQFETIHPFPDGNGRTGRALLHSMLKNKGLTRNVTIPISAGLLTDPDAYFAALTSYSEGDAVPIVERISEASFRAAHNGRQLAADITATRGGWNDRLQARSDSAAWRLADLLLRQPVIDNETVAAQLQIPPTSARSAINALVVAGVLTEFTGQRRNRMWEAKEITSALDEFASRAGRRRITS